MGDTREGLLPAWDSTGEVGVGLTAQTRGGHSMSDGGLCPPPCRVTCGGPWVSCLNEIVWVSLLGGRIWLWSPLLELRPPGTPAPLTGVSSASVQPHFHLLLLPAGKSRHREALP